MSEKPDGNGKTEEEIKAETEEPEKELEQEGKDKDRKFSQADVDRIVKDRLTREQKKYGDYDDLKKKADELDQLKESEKSDLQKAQEAKTQAESERDEALARADDTLIRAAFIAEASKAGASHPEDAYALADLSGVSIKDGKVEGVEEAVKALVDDKRLPLTGKGLAPELDEGAGDGDRKKTIKLTAEERAAAKAMGITEEQYAKAKEAPSLAPVEQKKAPQGQVK